MKILGPNTRSKVLLEMPQDDYVRTGYVRKGTVPNFIWEGFLYPLSFRRGRSAVRLTFKNDCNRVYEMSANNVAKLLQGLCTGSTGLLMGEKGWGYQGRWTFAKEGSIVSIVPVENMVAVFGGRYIK